MSDVVPLLVGATTPAIANALNALDRELAAALNNAKSADVPQGLIVALLQAYAMLETRNMLDEL